jgi:hypothetical protein
MRVTARLTARSGRPAPLLADLGRQVGRVGRRAIIESLSTAFLGGLPKRKRKGENGTETEGPAARLRNHSDAAGRASE